jgi:hypothetical protein
MSKSNDTRLGSILVFLICQPRSGSTLLQHILGAHPQIKTLPEPWLMLHPIFALRTQGIYADYNARYARIALCEFLNTIPRGRSVWLQAVRNYALQLYSTALQNTGKIYFLDKSTRYYLIIPELREIFPKSKFIFLLRHPLAVFSSRLNFSLKEQWWFLSDVSIQHDLLSAPKLILDAIKCNKCNGNNSVVVHYEKLVRDPENTVKRICSSLQLEFYPEIVEYGRGLRLLGTSMGDTRNVHKHERPVAEYIDQWRTDLNTPLKRYLARSYLLALGKEVVECLGYNYDMAMDALGDLPRLRKLWMPRWDELMKPPAQRSLIQYSLIELLKWLQCRSSSFARRMRVSGMINKQFIFDHGSSYEQD